MLENKQYNIKKLQETKFETDAEFARYKQTVELANEDERFEVQKRITIWVASSFILFPIIILIAGILGYNETITTLVEIAPSYFVGACGIIAVFIGGEAYKSGKNKVYSNE